MSVQQHAAPVDALTGIGAGYLRNPAGRMEQRVLRRVKITWLLLLLNVLTYYSAMPTLLGIPGTVGKVCTQVALLAALLLALTTNRPITVRPNVALVLITLLVAGSLVAVFHAQFALGAVFRTGRLAGFIAVLWLLSPWWGREDLLFVKAHLTGVWAVLGSVCLGVALAPGLALQDNRLTGAIWPVPPTQVAHYAAVATGLAIVLWLSGRLRRELALLSVAIAVPMLLLTHTRTALVAMLAGVFIAGLSLFTARARVRRAFAVGFIVLSLGMLTVSSLVTTWLARGQDTEQLMQLTGRTKVWDAVVAEPRTAFEYIFGFGLTNKSFNGLPIDSNWLAAYHDQGLFGVTVTAALLLFLLVLAAFRPQGPKRALAIFLVVYSFVASFTETGPSDASLYLLEVALAAILLTTRSTVRGTS
ncbi:MAG: hypothetical protein ACRDMV_16390 [Streptosporangiales bacterium]